MVADAGLTEPVVHIVTQPVGSSTATSSSSRPGRSGTTSSSRWWPRVAAASRRCPGSPARWGQRPSRMSGPTARRSRRPSLVCAYSTGRAVRSPRGLLNAPDFSYRDSIFKRQPQSHVILAVAFELPRDDSAPIRYAELARTLGVEVGERAAGPAVREAVLRLRRTKGMVLDPNDRDTCSAGSFFTNPLVDAVPDGAPAWPQPDGRIKTSAAWLIENAGVGKGFRLPGSQAAVSSRHTLALTNIGDATTTQLLDLAREIRSRVRASVRHRTQARAGVLGLLSMSAIAYSDSSPAILPTPSTRSSSPSA